MSARDKKTNLAPQPANDEYEHGPSGAFYNNLPGPEQYCVLECVCGESFTGPSWEDVGSEFDDHIRDTRQHPQNQDHG